MNYLDLFSGIGGFSLGAYWAGMRFENHYFSEVDEYAIEVYRQRFPGAIPLGDITKIDTARLMADSASQGLERQKPTRGNGREQGLSTECDWLITGGFPCTDISIAGKGAGIRGSRSGLWFEMWRIIRDLRPRFAIIENVGAITHRGLDTVLANLAEIGMDAEWQDIRASDVGAPHRRERIWIVAYPGKQGAGHLDGSASNERWATSKNRREGLRQGNGTAGSGGIATTSQDVANSKDTNGRGADGESDRRRGHSEAGGCGIKRSGVQHWNSESGIRRVAYGIPSRIHRLKCLGNAIVPQIAEILFRRIKELW